MLMSATDASYPAPADSGAYEPGLMTVGESDMVESSCCPSWSAGHHCSSWASSKDETNANSGKSPAGESPLPAHVLSTS